MMLVVGEKDCREDDETNYLRVAPDSSYQWDSSFIFFVEIGDGDPLPK